MEQEKQQPATPPVQPSADKRNAESALWDTPVSDSFYRGAEADMVWRNDARWN